MDDETAGAENPNDPEVPSRPIEPPPLAEVVRNALLRLADWQEVTERIKTRVRTSKLKPPPEPPEIIP